MTSLYRRNMFDPSLTKGLGHRHGIIGVAGRVHRVERKGGRKVVSKVKRDARSFNNAAQSLSRKLHMRK